MVESADDLLSKTASASLEEGEGADDSAAAQAVLRARVGLLRSQLDPDFLFNTLNSASALILARRHAEADQLIVSLAHYLRASSAPDGPAFIPLEREMGLARAFLEIHVLRMDRLASLDVVCAADVAPVSTPSLILLPLVQAAAVCAVESEAACDAIVLDARGDGAEVLIELAQRFDGPGHGGSRFLQALTPLSTRLAMMYGSADRLDVDVRSDSVTARLRLPAD